MCLTRTVRGFLATKELEKKNAHKLIDNCVFSRILNTQYIKLSGKGQLNRKAGLVIDVFLQIPKLNELHLLCASAWLCILGRLKHKKNCLRSLQYMAQNFDKSFFI